MAPQALTTLAKVKKYLKIDAATSPDDGLLAQLIASECARFESRTCRRLLSEPHTEVRDGRGGTRLLMKQYPVTAVAALTVGETVIPLRTADAPEGYVITGDEQDELALIGYTFCRGTANVAITYTAGYLTVPEDVDEALVEAVALRYMDRDHVGVSYKVVEGQVADFRGGGQLPFIEAVIERYRRPAGAG